MGQPATTSLYDATGAAPAGEAVGVSVKNHWPWGTTWILLLSVAAVLAAPLVAQVHGAEGFFLPVVAVLVCLLAALFDGWTRRIPNQLTYPAILLGLALNGAAPLLGLLKWQIAATWLGAAGWQSSGAGFLICAALGVLACLAAGVHGGDIKLLAAVGAMLGFTETANVLIVALAAAVVYALVNLAFFGGLNAVVGRATMWVLEVIYLRRLEKPWGEGEGSAARASHIPMAVPLFIGIVVAEFWRLRMLQGVGG